MLQEVVQNRLAAIGAIATATAALFSALARVPTAAEDTIEKWGAAPPLVQWLSVIALALTSVYLLIIALRRRSKLLAPEAFRIDPANPRFLKGREDETAKILTVCRINPLLHIEGESGCGKTSLLQAGLTPSLRAAGFLPIYIDLVGIDWASQLPTVVTQALLDGLTAEEKNRLCPDGQPLSAVLAQCSRILGRRPIIAFDQFDDYQVEHSSHFLDAGMWRDAAQIETDNPFWAVIADLLRQGLIHCIFLTRADGAAGLVTVRFVKERTFHLTRISRNLIAPLLDELAGPTTDGKLTIDKPDAGWIRLRQRLMRDVSVNDRVLPIQLVVALEALRRLRYLTVQEYDRAGGAPGLERLHIERNVDDTAEATGLSRTQVLRLLVTMCNAQGTKTVPASLRDFISTLSQTGKEAIAAAQVSKALEFLAQRRLVRRRVGDNSSGDVWLLSHDFLARGTLASQRYSTRWQLTLQESQKTWDDALSLGAKWVALLKPTIQLRLAWERIRGRIVYGDGRRIASVSILKFIPLLAVIGAVALGISGVHYFAVFTRANAIFHAIGQQSIPTQYETSQLSELARAPEDVQEAVVRLAFERPGDFERSAKRLDILLHIWLGMDPDGARRKLLHEEIIPEALDRYPDDRIYRLVLYAWKQVRGTSNQAADVTARVMALAKRERTEDYLAEDLEMLGEIPTNLTAAEIVPLLERAHASAGAQPAVFKHTMRGLAAFLLNQPDIVVQEAFDQLNPPLKGDSKFHQFESQLADAMVDLILTRNVARRKQQTLRHWCAKLSPEARSRFPLGFPPDFDEIGPDMRFAFEECRAAAAAGANGKAGPVVPIADLVHEFLESKTREESHNTLSALYARVHDMSNTLIDSLVRGLQVYVYENDSYDIAESLSLWAAVALRRDQAYVDAQLDRILDLLRNKEYLELPSELTTLANTASQGKRARLRAKLISELRTAEDPSKVWTFVQLIVLVTAAGDSTSRLEAAKAALARTRDRLFLSSYERLVWRSLVVELPQKDARALADIVLPKAANPRVAADFLGLLSSVAGKLSESQIARVTDRLYSLLVDDSSTSSERFSDDRRRRVARAFLGWAFAAPAGQTLDKDLLSTLTFIAQSVPYFSMNDFSDRELDPFDLDFRYEVIPTGPDEIRLAQRIKGLSIESEVNILKLPYSRGGVQRIVLAALEDRAGTSFDGDIWKFVQWVNSPAGRHWKSYLDAAPGPSASP